MKTKSQKQKPTKRKLSLLRQVCNFIPNHLVPQLAPETGVEDGAHLHPLEPRLKAGSSKAAKIPIIAASTSNSIRAKAHWVF
jgi:hypothetical protein